MDTHMTGFSLSIGSVKYLEEMVKNTQTLFDPSIPVIPKIKLTFLEREVIITLKFKIPVKFFMILGFNLSYLKYHEWEL